MNKTNDLLELNVNHLTEKKNGLTYLPWANAWREFIKVYPKATYNIKKNQDGLPCFGNSELGYICYTDVTADDTTHEMWLPVMDHRNKSILKPTTFDINKTVMRCLAKNLAMFGLGLYIYAGEDLPNEEKHLQKQEIQDLKRQIFTVLKKAPELDRNKWIKGLKTGEVEISKETLDILISSYEGIK